MEVDPVIHKALRLLVCRKPDSAEQLKQMLFESLGRKYTPPEPAASGQIEKQLSQCSSLTTDLDTDEEGIVAIEDEATDLEDLATVTRYATPSSAVAEEGSMDADDFAFDMGISCVICRQFDVSSNNQLIECQECHNLYHQLCHSPAIGDNVSTWSCQKCSKSKENTTADSKVEGKDAATASKSESTKTESTSKSGGETKKSSSSASKKSSKSEKVKSDKKSKDKHGDKVRDPLKHDKSKHKSADKVKLKESKSGQSESKDSSKSDQSHHKESKAKSHSQSSSSKSAKSSHKEKTGSEPKGQDGSATSSKTEEHDTHKKLKKSKK